MSVRKDATGTTSSRSSFPRISLILVMMSLLVSAGCFGLRKLPAARGAAAPAVPPSAQQDDPPLEIKPPPPPVPGQPTGLVKDSVGDSPLKRLALKAVERERLLSNYIVRIRRREMLDGKNQPEEIILLKFRRSPLSVHLKWLGEESRGREIVYVQGQHDNKIHVLTGKGDFLGAGRKMSFLPDNPMVRSKSRYPITEAGLSAATLRFAGLIDAIERAQPNAGSARYLGQQNRPEFSRPVEAVEQSIPPGLESAFPKGGTRFYYFDETIGLPTLVYTLDANKQVVEYYHFDRLQSPSNLDDSDFNPAELWRR